MDSNEANTNFWADFEKLEHCFVPRISSDAVGPCNKDDFQEYRRILLRNLHSIESMLDVLVKNEDQWTKATKTKLLKVLMIIGEQHCKSPWNTDEIVTLSQTMVPKVCKIFRCKSLTEIFNDDNLFLSAIMLLRGKLMRDTWKSFPAAVICYKWLLELVEKPFLKRNIPEVLPTALIIFDDYVQDNQNLGLQCVNLIIEHCQQSRALRNLNYDQVIYEALHKMAHKVEPDMIVPLYLCISNLLDCMEYCDNTSNVYRWSRRDDIFILLLGNMELESNVKARWAYIVSLKKLVTHLSCGKWSERISRILSDYCEQHTDDRVTYATLDFLQFFLAIYQPKSQHFYIAIYSSLLRLKFKLSLTSGRELILKVEHCISVLNGLCPSIKTEIVSNNDLVSAGVVA